AQIKKQFGDVTVLVRENETSLPEQAYNRPPREEGPARLLFVSRLDEKKGLHILLESLENNSQPVELKIVGAFENAEYESRCRSHIEQLGDNISIEFSGPLQRDEVLQSMRSADLFVFPTAGENFGHVIAEALSQSCPVMCSANTPWTSWVYKGGVVAVHPNTFETWNESLNNFMESEANAWEQMSSHAGETFSIWRN